MVKRRSTHRVLKRHLKFAGIERATEKRYATGVERFFRFSEFFFARLPQNGTELNYFLGEFVNHLYQDDSPHQWGVDAYAAVRRFLPAWRDHTALARMYLRNWSRTLTIRRALPLPVDIIMGMIGVAAVQDKWALCGAMYIGYLGLLRTGELLSLRVSQVTDYADTGCVVLSLPDSKGAKRKNVGEFVMFTDIHARMLLRRLVAGKAAADSVFGLSYTDLKQGLETTAAAVGVFGDTLTPYALRRGGATYHFSRFTSLDLTTSYGRWAFAGTARRYISQAMSDLESVKQPQEGRDRAARFARIFPVLLRVQG